jgi:hypothetical protein
MTEEDKKALLESHYVVSMGNARQWVRWISGT